MNEITINDYDGDLKDLKKIRSKFNDPYSIRAAACMFLLCLAFFFVMVYTFYQAEQKKSLFVESEAYFEKVEYGLILYYFVDTKLYTQDVSDENMEYTDQGITIYYNSENPEEYRLDAIPFLRLEFVDDKETFYTELVLFAVFLTMAIVFLIIGIWNKKGVKKLIQNGMVIDAALKTVTHRVATSTNTSGSSVTTRQSDVYGILCHTVDGDGKEILYMSWEFGFNPVHIIEALQLDSFKVYVDRKKPQKYHVDISEITKNKRTKFK